MKKLIKLSDIHYIIVDDSEIKANEWFYSPALNREQIFGDNNIPKDRGFKKITHSFGKKLDGVNNLPLSELESFIAKSFIIDNGNTLSRRLVIIGREHSLYKEALKAFGQFDDEGSLPSKFLNTHKRDQYGRRIVIENKL